MNLDYLADKPMPAEAAAALIAGCSPTRTGSLKPEDRITPYDHDYVAGLVAAMEAHRAEPKPLYHLDNLNNVRMFRVETVGVDES